MPARSPRSSVVLVLVVGLGAFAPGTSSSAQTTTLTVVDDDPIDPEAGEPGPGDNLVFSVRRNAATYVVSLAFTTGAPGEIVTHRLHPDGDLDFVGRTPAGHEPRQIALAGKGEYAVVVNSIDNEVASFRLGDDGLLSEVDRVPSGGDDPYDVAVVRDVAVVVNRGSSTASTYAIDKHTGTLTLVGSVPTGIDPHVVAVSSRGFVAVANEADRSVSVSRLDRKGEVVQSFPPVAMSIAGTKERMNPRAIAWHDRTMIVALDAPPGTEDPLRVFSVDKSGVAEVGDVPCGVFLTDVDANEDGVFAVTVNQNGPDPDRNEIRAYRVERGRPPTLTQVAAVQTEGAPSFQQVATFPGEKPIDRHVLVTEFQNGWLRSLLFDYRRR